MTCHNLFKYFYKIRFLHHERSSDLKQSVGLQISNSFDICFQLNKLKRHGAITPKQYLIAQLMHKLERTRSSKAIHCHMHATPNLSVHIQTAEICS